MGTMLTALLRVQVIERDLSQTRHRLKTRKHAVDRQQARIDQLKTDLKALSDKAINRRKDADRLELDLRQTEEQVARLRTSLNTTKTNKEYATLLTQINTIKADDAKTEEDVIKILQEVDVIKADTEKIQAQLQTEEKRLAEIVQTSGAEIARLSDMIAKLDEQRKQAAEGVPPDPLAVFSHLADNYEGEAMAVIEVIGRKPPYDYVCGGCHMSLNAEHANALRTRDEIRTCDNCRRILYLEEQAAPQKRQATVE